MQNQSPMVQFQIIVALYYSYLLEFEIANLIQVLPDAVLLLSSASFVCIFGNLFPIENQHECHVKH